MTESLKSPFPFMDYLIYSPTTPSTLTADAAGSAQIDSDGFLVPQSAKFKSKPRLRVDTSNSSLTPSLTSQQRASPRLGSPITPNSPSLIGVFLDSPRGNKRTSYGSYHFSPRLSSPLVVHGGFSFSVAGEAKAGNKRSLDSIKSPVARPHQPADKASYSPLVDIEPREVRTKKRVVLGKWRGKLLESFEANTATFNAPRGGKVRPQQQQKIAPKNQSSHFSEVFVSSLAAPSVPTAAVTHNEPVADNQVVIGDDLVYALMNGLGLESEHQLSSNDDLIMGKNVMEQQQMLLNGSVFESQMRLNNSSNFDWSQHHQEASNYSTSSMGQIHPAQLLMDSVNNPTSMAQQLTQLAAPNMPILKQFSCPFPDCDHEFSRRHDLLRHLRIHTNEKPFRCDRCLKAFTRLDALKRHAQVSEKYGGQCRVKRGRVPKSVAMTSQPQQ